ncbi:MAG: hypothetical protein KF709_06080 [Gemmatimonadaceae bacterium]|nr:hypothetical protein [Gemmatimonadaceae bacterium]
MSRSLGVFVALFFSSALTACATTGATFGSGVGDAMLSRAPFYAGASRTAALAAGVPVGALPIVFQPRDGSNEIFEPSAKPGTALAQLLVEMNTFLDSLRAANGAQPLRVIASGVSGVAPDVRFGCFTEGDLPGADCVARGDSALGRVANLQQAKLSVGRPSSEWVASAASAMDAAGVAHVLVIRLEIGQLWLRQQGIAGRKSVEIGSDNVVPVPWLTSLETPVSVLQLTGALVGRDGKAVRIGAEGILPKRTPLLASGMGAESLLSDADVQNARTLRREELPGAPLAWQEALVQLVQRLTR